MDELPDPILITIFNFISDIKTLTRSRLVSRRFNSLISQSDSLSLRVDRVISAVDSAVLSFFKTVFKSLFRRPHRTIQTESPAVILRAFEKVKELTIELPGDDVKRSEKKAVVRWAAEYGRSLKVMVILGFRCGGVTEVELGGGGGLKTRVVWTISSLISASARHYMVRDIVSENKSLRKLVVKDRENEGVVVMNELGINEHFDDESRKTENEDEEGEEEEGGGVWWRSNRTRVPAVWMRMRHEAKLELSNGVVMEGATLVVV
ncbi:F-box protein [Tanacetum coccineum]